LLAVTVINILKNLFDSPKKQMSGLSEKSYKISNAVTSTAQEVFFLNLKAYTVLP